MNERDLKRLTKIEGFITLQIKNDTPMSFCDACALGKMKAKPHRRNLERSSAPLARIFIDLVAGPCEAIHSKALWGLHISDDYTKMVWHIPLRTKDQAFDAFKQWLVFIQKQTGHIVRQLRNGRGGEFGGGSTRDIGLWAEFCKQQGIQQQFTNPDTPQQNDVERHNQTILYAARTMMISAGLPTRFWSEAMATACYLRNMSPAHGAGGNILLLMMFPKANLDVGRLRRFGSQAFAHIHTTEARRRGQKFAPTSRKCFLVGYAKHTAGYRLFDPTNQEIFERTDVIFNEDIVYKDRHEVLKDDLWLPKDRLITNELADSADSDGSNEEEEDDQPYFPSQIITGGVDGRTPPLNTPAVPLPERLPARDPVRQATRVPETRRSSRLNPSTATRQKRQQPVASLDSCKLKVLEGTGKRS